jgi:hypothetical protein
MEAHPQFAPGRHERGILQAFEAQLVEGVRRVGDKLPKEHLFVAIKGIHHQLEQLADFRLEGTWIGWLGRHGLLSGALSPPNDCHPVAAVNRRTRDTDRGWSIR